MSDELSDRQTDVPPDHPPSLEGISEPFFVTLNFSADLHWVQDLLTRVVVGGVYLCAGAPGSNKSTFARQLATDLAQQGHRCLFVLTEERVDSLKLAVTRMTPGLSLTERSRLESHVLFETGLEDVEQLPRFLAHNVLSPGGPFHGTSFMILDSIQGSGLNPASGRKWRALFEACGLMRSAKVTTFLVCHVTKRGEFAGPRALEHHVDAAIVLRKAGDLRFIGVPKNRYGPEVYGLRPLEIDPETVTLHPSQRGQSMVAVAKSYLPGVGVTEVQGMVRLPRWGSTARITAPGLPRREIQQLIGCIGQVDGLQIDDLDHNIQCRMPGERTYRAVLGLPLALALISSYLQLPVPENQLQIGEVDLTCAVRDLPTLLISDLNNAMAKGQINLPVKLLVPPSAADRLPWGPGVEVVPCSTLQDAIRATWPQLQRAQHDGNGDGGSDRRTA